MTLLHLLFLLLAFFHFMVSFAFGFVVATHLPPAWCFVVAFVFGSAFPFGVVFPFVRVGKSAVLDRRLLHKERAHLFSLSLFSSGICLALRGGERPQREREREGDGGATVYAPRELFLSLSLLCEIFLSPLGFPYRRGEPETTRG